MKESFSRLNTEELKFDHNLSSNGISALGVIETDILKSSIEFVPPERKNRQSQMHIREGHNLSTFQYIENLETAKLDNVENLEMAEKMKYFFWRTTLVRTGWLFTATKTNFKVN